MKYGRTRLHTFGYQLLNKICKKSPEKKKSCIIKNCWTSVQAQTSSCAKPLSVLEKLHIQCPKRGRDRKVQESPAQLFQENEFYFINEHMVALLTIKQYELIQFAHRLTFHKMSMKWSWLTVTANIKVFRNKSAAVVFRPGSHPGLQQVFVIFMCSTFNIALHFCFFSSHSQPVCTEWIPTKHCSSSCHCSSYLAERKIINELCCRHYTLWQMSAALLILLPQRETQCQSQCSSM